MYFDSLQALIGMDGHGPYVWTAYAISLVTLAAMLVTPLGRRRRFLAQQAQIVRRQQARQQS